MQFQNISTPTAFDIPGILNKITNEGLTYEYLAFIKENVLLFKDVELNKDDFFYCNLYKYFTTKV